MQTTYSKSVTIGCQMCNFHSLHHVTFPSLHVTFPSLHVTFPSLHVTLNASLPSFLQLNFAQIAILPNMVWSGTKQSQLHCTTSQDGNHCCLHSIHSRHHQWKRKTANFHLISTNLHSSCHFHCLLPLSLTN